MTLDVMKSTSMWDHMAIKTGILATTLGQMFRHKKDIVKYRHLHFAMEKAILVIISTTNLTMSVCAGEQLGVNALSRQVEIFGPCLWPVL